jgi:flagellar protein FliO/FliZ
MLLVKSRESKNLGKSMAQLLLSTFLFIALPVSAQGAGPTAPSYVSILLSLFVVIAMIFAVAFVMRRFNVTQSGSSDLKSVATMMVGTKERIMVIEVGDEQHLVGITATSINHLSKLDTPISSESRQNPGDLFKAKLAQFIQPQINPTGTNKAEESS